MSQISFQGRAAVVTGSGAGLGRAYALDLARRGAQVVVNDLDDAAAAAVVAEIQAAGGTATASVESVADETGAGRIVETALREFGRLDVLVNNAGILRDRSFLKLRAEDVDAVLGVHLRGAFAVTRPAFAAMKEAGYGRIVFTTSSVGLFGNFGQANYAAAKMGLVGLARALAVEGARSDIRVNVVAPSAATTMTGDMFGPIADRFGADLVAPMAVYLASSECAETGQIYWAGGGRFARVAISQAAGWVAGSAEVTAEDVRDHLEAIEDMSAAFTPRNAMDELGRVLEELGLELPMGAAQ